MLKNRFFPTFLAMVFIACTRFWPGHSVAAADGAYIDSVGFRASQARIDNVADQSSGNLIKQALEVPEYPADDAERPDFFQSLEDDYQKYLKIFKPAKSRKKSSIKSDYDLLETFRAKIFDPQPFMNAILHTLGLTETTTLDYAIQSGTSDTIAILVSWARPTALAGGKGFGITEGSLPLCVTKHSVFLAGPRVK